MSAELRYEHIVKYNNLLYFWKKKVWRISYLFNWIHDFHSDYNILLCLHKCESYPQTRLFLISLSYIIISLSFHSLFPDQYKHQNQKVAIKHTYRETKWRLERKKITSSVFCEIVLFLVLKLLGVKKYTKIPFLLI